MGNIIGIWGVFGIAIGLYFVSNIFFRAVYAVDNKTTRAVFILLFGIIGTAFEFFWFYPTALNSTMAFLGFSLRLGWKQIAPISLIFSMLRMRPELEYKVTKLWENKEKADIVGSALKSLFNNNKRTKE